MLPTYLESWFVMKLLAPGSIFRLRVEDLPEYKSISLRAKVIGGEIDAVLLAKALKTMVLQEIPKKCRCSVHEAHSISPAHSHRQKSHGGKSRRAGLLS
jgi:hypothetical protein